MCISNELNLNVIARVLIASQHVKYKSKAISHYKSIENMYGKYFSLSVFYQLDVYDTISIIKNKIEYSRIHKSAITIEFFKIIFPDELIAANSYITYCNSKTKKMKEVISSDVRYYSMNLESFIFREGEERGTISYKKFCDKQKLTSKRSIEYWKLHSSNQEEAVNNHKKYQATFSLEKCIQKYGVNEGTEKWNKRQLIWQKVLRKKTTMMIFVRVGHYYVKTT